MARTLVLTAGVVVWGASIYGATQLHRLDLDLGHGICGPWGCAAAPEALLGYHVLLAAVIVPGAALLALWLEPRNAVTLGRVAMALGFLALVGMFLWGAAAWLAGGGSSQYAVNSGLFHIATTPDVPAIPALLGGVAARLLGWARRGCCGVQPPDGSTP